MDAFQQVDTWKDRHEVLNFLAAQLVASRLVLVVGAGASAGCGLPSWDNLIDKAYQVVGAAKVTGHSTNEAAEHLYQAVLKGNDDAFAQAIRTSLYGGLNEAAVLSSPMLRALAAVAMVSARRNLTSVVTYNFDDLLETFLNRQGLYAQAAIRQPCWYEQEDVTVLHPHGFLSRRAAVQSSQRLTLTLSHFDHQTGNAADPWRQKLVDLMKRNTALFVGLSGDDPNLRSQLDEVKNEHVSKRDGHPFWGVRICKRADVKSSIWLGKNVWCEEVNDHSEVPELLMEVCSRSAEILQRKAAPFTR